MKIKLHWRTLKVCVEQGMTDPEIAEKYNCAITYVRQTRSSISLKPNHKKTPPADNSQQSVV